MPDAEKRIAKLIEVERRAQKEYSLRIDGQEFPFYLSPEGMQIAVEKANCPGITITIQAEEVRVLHSLNRSAPEAA